jgi:outer membrane protein OmpA-like peptidoglycan-associated protein
MIDTDGDGVFDEEDQCVNEPQGATPDPARRGCPAGDRDHDTVLDPADQCPDEPQGAFPDPARAGGPLPDRDHDTVPDPTDHCPDQPGAPSTDPNLNGCPGIVVTTGTSINILEQVFFDTNRATIKRRSFRVLERVADVLRASPHIRRVRIEGHTDNRSTPEHNLELSQQRAAAVLEWLATHNVARDHLDSRGFGQTCPIDSNDTNAGRARNRRVAFTIVDPAPPGGVPEGCPGAATTPTAPTTPATTPDAGAAGGRHGRHGSGRHGGSRRRHH